jgi:regulator of protease activity HflC (stomatin/prohibitin superfamily)
MFHLHNGKHNRKRKMNKNKRGGKLIAVGLLAVGALMLTGCSISTPIDQASVVYKDSKHHDFVKVVPAGKREGGIPAQMKEYRYPVNSRDFQFAANTEGAERAPIEVIAKGGVKMTVSGAVYFTLNDNPEILRQFHEQVGTTFHATDGEGDALSPKDWNAMLAKYIGTPVENALDRVSLEYTSEELTSDVTKKNEWQAAAQKQINTSINEVTGGTPYFCKPNYKPGKDDDCGVFSIQLNQAQPPQSISDAKADAAAQTIRNNSAADAQQAQKNAIAIFGVQGYLQQQQLQLMREALAKGNVPFLPVPAGGSINYTQK